jgi:hypothetical protein
VNASWQQGDVKKTLDQITGIDHTLSQRPVEQQTNIREGLVSYYLALGRLADAQRTVQSLGTSFREQRLRLLVAEAREDRDEFRRLVAGLPQANSTQYVRAGLLDQARRRISGPGNRVIKELAFGGVMLAEGHPEAAIPHLSQWSELTEATDLHDADLACDSLAAAWTQLGRPQEAVRVLEDCITNYRQFPWAHTTLGFWKLRLSVHLAKLYRQIGRVGDAETIETRIRRLLGLADRDFPLVQQLGN